MTSQAQLKYLDAMGIPVWVSRDSILFEENIGKVADIDSEQLDQALTSPAPGQVASAQNLLDSLDSDSTNIPDQTISNQYKESLDSNVAKSLNQSIIPDDRQSKTVDISDKALDKSNHSNLLYQSPYYYVYAQGSESAEWLVIGHSPEAFSGTGEEPFAGEAGVLLDNMLRTVGIDNPRQQAYLMNVLDANQSNEQSLMSEAQQALKKELLSVIEQLKPKMILLVGQIAAQCLLDSKDPLIIMRAKTHSITTANIPCVVTYYPSYLLLKPIDKRKAWEDLKCAMRILNEPS